MAVVAGHNGNFSLTGIYSTVSIEIFEWTATLSNDEYDSTTFATSGSFHVYAYGLARYEGHARGFLPSGILPFPTTDFAPGRAAGTLTLTTDTGETITVNPCSVNNLQETVNKQSGLNAVEFDFKGTVTGTATAP